MVTDDRILYPPRDAAAILSLSEKTLWNHTKPRGPIPAIRIGRSVRYARKTLERIIAEMEAGQVEAGK